MKRDSRTSIIPKIIAILGTLATIGIFFLFFRSEAPPKKISFVSSPSEKLFTQVIRAGMPEVLRLWEDGGAYLPKNGPQCPAEMKFSPRVGKDYFRCQPHLWQCYWAGGLREKSRSLEIEYFGRTYHLRALPSFSPIPAYSEKPRYYELIRKTGKLGVRDGMKVKLEITEFPGEVQTVFLPDSCRDTYLPERIYGYGKRAKGDGFVWDNFDRKIFIDKFYVSNQRVNEWKILQGKPNEILADRELWPWPAELRLSEQRDYCAFYGKRLLEANLFDAATMQPVDLKNPKPEVIVRAQTPWQRDLSKTFFGTARLNNDFQLTPLNCQLAQVSGCPERIFTNDSISWMGVNYGLGFYPESFENFIEPRRNLKLSSRFFPAASDWHELGLRDTWNGEKASKKFPVAFRCYEEIP